MLNGLAKLFFPSGEIWKGFYKNDRWHGISDSKWSENERMIFRYEDGLWHGVGLRFTRENLIADEYRDVIYIERYENGSLKWSVDFKI